MLKGITGLLVGMVLFYIAWIIFGFAIADALIQILDPLFKALAGTPIL